MALISEEMEKMRKSLEISFETQIQRLKGDLDESREKHAHITSILEETQKKNSEIVAALEETQRKNLEISAVLEETRKKNAEISIALEDTKRQNSEILATLEETRQNANVAVLKTEVIPEMTAPPSEEPKISEFVGVEELEKVKTDCQRQASQLREEMRKAKEVLAVLTETLKTTRVCISACYSTSMSSPLLAVPTCALPSATPCSIIFSLSLPVLTL
jgi:hypothetical protein